ncbi:MAG: hypothetical protein IJ092_12565 [Atopobiaceae bacterium]|nr:hypothetical protein [Atopobiaceae bacterium]
MAELLVIADDLTGALDSGVQLARKGQRVLVSVDDVNGLEYADQADVIVIDSESRHDDPQTAYGKVARLVSESRSLGIPQIYKKTDSGLRGNVGAELAAVLDASGSAYLNFVPAYPKQQRTTEGGVHYVAGVPLAKSIFAVDPLNPVTKSKVADLIHEQSDVSVTSWTPGGALEGIVVYDCATDDEMRDIAERFDRASETIPMAGCAGLLEMLPGNKALNGRERQTTPLPERLVVISGSVNAVTSLQLNEAERLGAYRRHLPVEQVLAKGWQEQEARAFVKETLGLGAECPVILIDTLGYQMSAEQIADETNARKISEAASLCAAVVSEASDRTVMIVGGDALVGFVEMVGATVLEPIDEIFPGIVIARYEGEKVQGTIVTKSGAFGDVGLFFDIHTALKEKVEE